MFTEIILPETIKTIGNHAFSGCIYVEEISIPEGVTTIEDSTFYQCKNLTNVNLPNSITTIEVGAFDECYSLRSIYIPSSVTLIEVQAFHFCSNLVSIVVDEDNENYSSDEFGVLFNKDKSILITYPAGSPQTKYVIPDGVKTIVEYAFFDCLYLTEIAVPDSVTVIEEGAFSECIGLTSISIPSTVLSIEDVAFYLLPFLEEITIKGMDVNIGECAFGLSELKIENIGSKDFADLFIQALKLEDNTLWEEIQKYMVYKDDGFWTFGTIYCHSGSTAEAYAIENGVDYQLTHFYEGDWTYDYDNMIRYRKCIHCDELETETLKTTNDDDVDIIAPEDNEFTVDVITDYVIIEETISNNITTDFEIVKAFDITMTNKDGVHVQPDGTVKVKLPLDWSKEGVYKVYRVNDDGTLTDMNAYRQGSHIVFDTDHFSIYVIVDESEKTDDPNIIEKDEVCPDCGRPAHEDTVVQNFVCWLIMLFKIIASLF